MSIANDIYLEVRKHKESSDKYKAEDYTVLEAIESIIHSRKGGQTQLPSPVEYFSCIMSTLSQSNDHYRSLLFLLQLVLPLINENVLRLKCNDCLEIFLNVYKTNSNEIEPSSLRSLVTCICILFCAQETNPDLWESSLVKRSFNLLLTIAMHDSGKVRRCVLESISPLLQLHHEHGFIFSSRQIIRQLDVLCKSFNEDDYHETINYLMLLQKIASFIHSSLYPAFFNTLLKIRQHQCPLLDYHCLRPIEHILSTNELLDIQLVESVFSQLMSQPCSDGNHEKDLCEYATVLCICSRIFMTQQYGDCYSYFVTIMKAIFSYFETPNAALHKLLSMYLISFFPSLKGIVIPEEIGTQLIQLVGSTLQFRYQHSWIYLLPTIASVIRYLGPMMPELTREVIQQLVAIYDSSVRGDAAFQLILTKTLGYCVEAVGVENFLQFVTLLNDKGLPDENHYYLFEIINDHSKHTHSSLLFFFNNIIPVAKACHVAAQQTTNPALKRRYQTYVTDLWNMFPSFCVCADDAAVAFEQFGNSILGAMTDRNYKELSVIICKGLTLLIRSNQLALENQHEMNEEEEEEDSSEGDSTSQMSEEELKGSQDDFTDEILPFLDILKTTRAPRIDTAAATHNLEVLQPLCENLLLTLLSLYEQWHGDYSEEIPRYSGIGKGGDNMTVQIIRCTIETVLHISQPDLVSKLLNQVLSKLLVAFTNENPAEQNYSIGQSIILTGLLSTVIQFIKNEEIAIILRCIKPHLTDDSIPILQKRVYYCLLSVCRYHAPFLIQTMLGDLQTMFLDSVLTINVISKKYRLRCFDYLSRSLDPSNSDHISFIIQSLPEVILCTKDPSKKVRAVCYHVIVHYAQLMNQASCSFTLPDGSQATASLSQFIQILTSCLAGQNPHMQAAALLSLSVVLNHFKSEMDLRLIQLNILHITYSLIREDNRETSKACIKYIRSCTRFLSDEDLALELPNMIQAIFIDIGSNKNRMRARIRMILENLVKRVGEEDLRQLLPEEDMPLLTSILRSERRKESSASKTGEDGDSKHLSRTRWIKEGEDPLDLLNVEDITRGITSRKEEEEESEEIEMDENGRFIVHEEEEEKKEDEAKLIPVKDVRRQMKVHQQRKNKKILSNEQDGSRFRSTRARGDMKKGGMQPYAYIRLDPGMLSKKKKNQSLGKFNNLIGAAKKGAREGASRRKKH